MKTETAAAHVLIKGRVQGVGYRFFAQDAAEPFALKGWVRNLPGGDVECVVEGPRLAIERFLEELRKGPPVARVDAVQVDWRPAAGQLAGFTIR
ncbi:MAG: hypothetical protein A2992_00165 [Elusimicrobia bacterium RIFCSPLOWO2_01_FULL_59_12]|nr:MAG: hypothetical protein A2992_00165 [Elusimicrobia bacterium RIFCSPLOWO2_01_FULL_59_12]